MDPDADPDPSIFITDLQDANKKLFKKFFPCILLFEGTYTSFSKIKSQKYVTKQLKSRFFLLYLLMIEGSGSRAGSGSGSIPLTNGSGRPKNNWIRWIRIRIRNTFVIPYTQVRLSLIMACVLVRCPSFLFLLGCD
jgi:hypothetical protein